MQTDGTVNSGIRALAVCFALHLPINALGQNIHVLEMTGQPLVYMHDGNLRGCGVRVFGLDSVPGQDLIKVFDISTNLYPDKGAVVKVSSYDTTVAIMKSRKPHRLFHLHSGWIRSPGAKATSPIAPAFKGDDGHAILYSTSVDSALEILKAALSEAIVQVGIRRQGEPTERIYAGKIALSAAELGQIRSCISDLAR